MEYVVPTKVPETPAQQAHRGKSVTAMVLGITSLVLVWVPLVGLILAIIGFSMSISNRRYAAANGFREHGMNTAGYICGLIGLIAGILVILLYAVMIVAGFLVSNMYSIM